MTFADLSRQFCSDKGITVEALKGRARHQPLAGQRQDFMAYAIAAGKSQSEVARYLGRRPSTISQAMGKGR